MLGVTLAISLSAGCAERPQGPETSDRSATQLSPSREFADNAFRWRHEARELRKLADRHDVEARILAESPTILDQKLLERKRALAEQLRLTADQADRRAEEAQSRAPQGMHQ